MSETSDSIQQGKEEEGNGPNKLLSALTLICNSVKLLGFQSLPKYIAYGQIFLPTLIFLSTVTKADKTQKLLSVPEQ